MLANTKAHINRQKNWTFQLLKSEAWINSTNECSLKIFASLWMKFMKKNGEHSSFQCGFTILWVNRIDAVNGSDAIFNIPSCGYSISNRICFNLQPTDCLSGDNNSTTIYVWKQLVTPRVFVSLCAETHLNGYKSNETHLMSFGK